MILVSIGECDMMNVMKSSIYLLKELRSLLGNEQQEALKELQELLEYYLAHLTRKDI
jgi:hypothetical protein